MVQSAAVTGFALAAGSDSGVASDPPTLTDKITNVTEPTLTGTAPQGTKINVYAVGVAGNVLLGTTTVPGTNLNQKRNVVGGRFNGQSQRPFDLRHDGRCADADCARRQYVRSHRRQVSLPIFLNTAGPQVSGVTNASNGQNVQTPTGPTPTTTALDIAFTDAEVRTTAFDFPVLDSVLAPNTSNYQLVGYYGGTIPISSATYTDSTVVGGSGGSGQVQLTFASPLPDDNYTLTVSDSLQSPAGNLAAGPAAAGQRPFTASFTVQGGLELAVQMTQGTQSTDLQAPPRGPPRRHFRFTRPATRSSPATFSIRPRALPTATASWPPTA